MKSFLGAVLFGCSGLVACAVDFNRDIRPVVFGKCVECHGPDKQKGGFRVDDFSSVTNAAESGATPIVPGKPEESEMLVRMRSHDPDERMPPKGDRVSDAEIALVEQWIASGAQYEKLWADQPIARPKPPSAGHPVDAFVRARLQPKGLKPHPEADRYALARRAALDIVGLPPSVEQLQGFVNDSAPNAYEKYLDALFASPHYGEKWGRWWLDLARFADTNGYESDEPRTMWAYRNWVIRALNQNLPFDQFTRMQMAGDLFENPTIDDRIATGFHRNSLINTEGGSKEDEFKDAAIKDRVHTTFTVWMASTMECAQCHTHKYDPIEQTEYYQVYALFNNTTDRGTGGESDKIDVPTETPADLEAREQAVAKLEKQATADTPEVRARFLDWLKAQETAYGEAGGENPSGWKLATGMKIESKGGATFKRQADFSYLASGKNPAKDRYRITLGAGAQSVAAIKLEVLPDPSMANQSLGRSSNGNFVLTDVELRAGDKEVAIVGAVSDYAQANYPISASIDVDAATGWAVDGNIPDKRVARTAVFTLEEPVSSEDLVLDLHCESRFGQHTIGRLRISLSAQSDAGLGGDAQTPLKIWLNTPKDQRSVAVKKDLFAYFGQMDTVLAKARKQHAAAKKALDNYKSKFKTTVMVMNEGKRRPAFVQERGDFLQPREEVQPGVPMSFGVPLPKGDPASRLELAQWLVDPKNPRPARVTVNRFWDELFGRGLSVTSEDFGVQGDVPSHPDLLNWLAAEFVESGWDMKGLLKTIMMSATYRQHSSASEAERKLDYYNVWLARGPRFRVQAEMVRDIGLQASGLLTPTIGGPSVFPPQPASIWENLFVEGGLKRWPESTGKERYRRGLYTYVKRTALHPMLRNFDAPSRSVCTVRRKRSNTPLAALNTLNDPAFVEFAGGLAHLLATHEGKLEDKIAYGFLRCASRPPRPAEIAVIRTLLTEEYTRYRDEEDLARALIDSAFADAPPAVDDPIDLAAWIVAANVMLNMDATLTKR